MGQETYDGCVDLSWSHRSSVAGLIEDRQTNVTEMTVRKASQKNS